jgi:hypothetical protein
MQLAIVDEEISTRLGDAVAIHEVLRPIYARFYNDSRMTSFWRHSAAKGLLPHHLDEVLESEDP